MDTLLSPQCQFSTGSLWEICGVSGVGKTQFCHTMAVNFVLKHPHTNVLYIDIKVDFSGKRIRQILRNRNINKIHSGNVMSNIKVERTFSLEGLVQILENFLKLLEQAEDLTIQSIKFIIIDSVPALTAMMRSGEIERFRG